MKLNNISEVDRDALQRAIDSEGLDPQRALRPDSSEWRKIAEAAAYSCQVSALKLKPWQVPPCAVQPDDHDTPANRHQAVAAASKLHWQLCEAGFSRFEPDPLHALDIAEDGGPSSASGNGSGASKPVALSDDQMNAICAAANPLPRSLRGEFLKDCCAAIAALPMLGDGSLHRLIVQLQRNYLQGGVRGPAFAATRAWRREFA